MENEKGGKYEQVFFLYYIESNWSISVNHLFKKYVRNKAKLKMLFTNALNQVIV